LLFTFFVLPISLVKIYIKTLYSGIDFLGWINFFDYRVLRIKTKNRMFKRLNENNSFETFNSYLGLLYHGNTKKLRNKLLSINAKENLYFF